MGKRDMKNKTPPSGAKSQSLVLRLNTRLFFLQLGFFLCMDLLLVVLALMGWMLVKVNDRASRVKMPEPDNSLGIYRKADA